jgi:fucose 4-O-acetylase-like acetyltransferase
MQRDLFIDSTKGFLIFLVVIGHAIEPFIFKYPAAYLVYGVIYSFHMPLFIFIAGQNSITLDKQRFRAYKDFLFPYLVLNTVWYLFTSLVSQNFEFSFLNPGWVLWFLLSMFTWKILIEHLIKVKYIVIVSLLLGLVVGFFSEFGITLSLSRTVAFFFFFILGYYSANNRLLNIVKKHRIIVLVVGFINFAILTWLFLFAFNTDYARPFNLMLVMANAYSVSGYDPLTGMLIRFGLIGSALLTIMVWMAISFKQTRNTLLTKIGAHSLVIFIGHAYIVHLAHRFGGMVDGLPMKVILIVTVIFLSMLLYLPIWTFLYNKIMGKLFSIVHRP